MSEFREPIKANVDADLAPVGLIEIDDRRSLVAANAKAEMILRQSRRSLSGRALSEVIFYDSPLFGLLDRADLRAGDIAASGVPIAGPSLPAISIDLRITANGADGGRVIAFAPAMAREADPPGGLAEFARLMGHEIKNPLAGISGAAQLLQRDADEARSELLDLIRFESSRIERLVNRLSVFELFSSPNIDALNIHEALDKVVMSERAASGEAVSIERHYDPSLPAVLGDADHLYEAFQNLVRNAVEAAVEANGHRAIVRVRTAYEPGLGIASRTGRKSVKRAARISVEDNGPGVPPDRHAKVFEMFQTSKARGSGLGLTVVNEVVNAHGGHISLESKPGDTRFCVRLPLDQERV